MVPNGYSQVVATYGNPSLGALWEASNLVYIDFPFPMRLAWDPSVTIRRTRVHRFVASELTQIMWEIWAYARLEIKKKFGYDKTTEFYNSNALLLLRSLGLDLYGGAYNYRPIRGRKRLSIHAFGAAIDIDPAHNQLGHTIGRMPSWVVKIFKKYGWLWGGNYQGRKDWMHFQRATGA